MPEINPIVLVVGLIALAVVAFVAFLFSRYRVTKPDEAFIVTGRRSGDSGQKVIVSGSTFVIPVIEDLYRISLASKPLNIRTEALDSDNIPLTVEATASVKVGGTTEKVRLAGQRFLHSQQDIESFTDGIVSGVLRAVIGEMNTRDVIGNRETLSQKVLDAATAALGNQGLELDSLQILSITDPNGYIAALGAPKDAEVKKEAARAKAIADQQAAEAQLAAEQVVAEKQRDLAVKRAQFRAEQERAEAEASAAGPTQQAVADKAIAEQETLTAAERAKLREAQLLAEVKAPAAAAAEKTRIDASAAKDRAVAEAQARAEAIAIEAKAEADRIRALGEAEAEATLAKAEAMKQYGEAASMQMVLDRLPAIVREASAPMANIEGMTVVSTDGASDLVRQGANALGQVTGILNGMGIDLTKLGKTQG